MLNHQSSYKPAPSFTFYLSYIMLYSNEESNGIIFLPLGQEASKTTTQLKVDWLHEE